MCFSFKLVCAVGKKNINTKGFPKGTNTSTSYDKSKPSFKLEHEIWKSITRTQNQEH